MTRTDEISASKVEKGSAVRAYSRRFHNIYLFITERCQLRCGHCYMGERLEAAHQMPYERATFIIGYMHRMGAEYLTFVGGEPTLHAALPKMVSFARSVGYQKVMIDTNALLPKRIQKISPQDLFYVRVSLDGGSEETHDRVRGAGNFRKAVSGIEELVRTGYSVRITSTLLDFNVHEAFKIIKLAEELGVQLVNFHSFSPEGYGADKTSWAVSPARWMDFCAELEATKVNSKVEIRYPPTWTSKSKLGEYVSKGFDGCLGCSVDRLSIFPDGRCYICSLLFDQSAHFATIDENGLKLNRGRNEFELFQEARLSVKESADMGCPAETLLRSPTAEQRGDLISVCRLWRTSA